MATTDESRPLITYEELKSIEEELNKDPLLPPVYVMNDEETDAYIDQVAQYELGMSREKFIRAWNAGKWADDPDQPGVMRVAMMLGLA